MESGPYLSQPQVKVLVLWSFGIVVAQSCGLTTVAVCLAALLGTSEATVREQLRDWYRDAVHKSGAKRGTKRRTLEVAPCFAPLLRWVLAWTMPTCRQLALAMDASTLGQRFTLLSISVVVCGCAIPVAWCIVEATRAGAWRPHWEALFGYLQNSVPPDWTVIVLADRGLYARWLFTTIQQLGWHPFLRINRQGQYRPQPATTLRPLTQVVGQVGQRWAGPVVCFATPARQLACTLLARWDVGYRDPWLGLTDLPPHAADVAWYGLRAWIECGFKDSKRGGWHWEQTKMLNPARAERLWLALAVATLWTVSVGCQAEALQPTPQLNHLPERHIARQRSRQRDPVRQLSAQLLPAWTPSDPGGTLYPADTAARVYPARDLATQSVPSGRRRALARSAIHGGVRKNLHVKGRGDRVLRQRVEALPADAILYTSVISVMIKLRLVSNRVIYAKRALRSSSAMKRRS